MKDYIYMKIFCLVTIHQVILTQNQNLCLIHLNHLNNVVGNKDPVSTFLFTQTFSYTHITLYFSFYVYSN